MVKNCQNREVSVLGKVYRFNVAITPSKSLQYVADKC